VKYSYNLDREGIVFAGASDINASFKDLCCVCDSIRHKPVPDALMILDETAAGKRAIEFKRHNKYMGSRHELGGKKGRWPKKCAAIVRKVLVNASANAKNKGEDPESMYIVHAAANKTIIVPRRPPKGIRSVRTGGYGYVPSRRSDIEFARIEMGIAYKGPKKTINKDKNKPAPKVAKAPAADKTNKTDKPVTKTANKNGV